MGLVLAAAQLVWSTGCMKPIQVGVGVRLVPELASPGNSGSLTSMNVPDTAGDADGPAIAVVDVDGLLLNADLTGIASSGENPVSLFRERLDSVACNPCVKGVVIRINSPGGGVTATDIMWHDLTSFRERTKLPITACLMDLGAGGAYYLATAADQIVAHPTSITGGIGVILNTYNLQDALQQFNITAIPIKAGDKVDLGSPVKTMDAAQRKILQTMADEFHKRFQEVVAEGRPEVDMDDKSNFDGRVFTAKQAEQRRLVDYIGYLDDAVTMTRRMAHIHHARVLMFHRQNDKAHTPYAITPNIPLTAGLVPISLPGLDRSRLPGFLYMWQPEPTMERLSGK